ncbi:MAG: GNAT family N-acetyltransferase [Ilumatobacteraceae bacterium]
MSGEGTVIRAVEAADLAKTRQWRNDPRVANPSLGRRFPITEGGEREWFEGLGRGAFPTQLTWAVATEESSIVGLVQLRDIDWIHRTAEFGIWIGPEHWGQGHATRATRLVCAHATRGLGLRQLRLRVVDGHDAAVTVYERNGFVREGLQRNAVLVDGRFADLVLMVRDVADLDDRVG